MRKQLEWKDISINQFEQIQKVFEDDELEDFSKSAKLVSIIYNKKLEDIPLQYLRTYFEPINKLLASRYNKSKDVKDYYNINGNVYKFTKKIENISTAAFVDYSEYIKMEDNTLLLLSCVLIPKGHTYNDGYDMETVLKDMGCLSVEDVSAISFFLLKTIRKLQQTTMNYSLAELLVSKMKWKNKKKLLSAALTLCQNMDY